MPSYQERLHGPAWAIVVNGRTWATVARKTREEALEAFKKAGMIPSVEYELRRIG